MARVNVFDDNGLQPFQVSFFCGHASRILGLGLSGRLVKNSAKKLKFSAREATSINVFIAG